MRDGKFDLSHLVATLLSFVERNLTPISIIVLLVGVGLIAAGPVSGLLSRSDNLTASQAAESAEEQPAQASFVAGIGGGEGELELVLQREPEPFTIIPNRQRDDVISYTVQPGDTIFDLSDRFGVSMETIFWANADTLQDNVHLLVPGLTIFIMPQNGVYHRADGEQSIAEIAESFGADPNGILDTATNELPPGSDLSFVPPLGMRLLVPGGSREQIDFTWVAAAPAGAGTGSDPQTVVFAPGHAGSCAAFTGGSGTGLWARPVNSYHYSQGFHYGHTGVDLSSTLGEPVYAADSGVVIFAGWNDWGYGNLVAINHGLGGWTTLYAHLNSVNVGCGQTVGQGTQIGSIGSTGNSSGPHLHFEMRWGFGMSPDNPTAYIGF